MGMSPLFDCLFFMLSLYATVPVKGVEIPDFMIVYQYKNPKILFVGINPHPGSFSRGVPFSNNKMLWYLLSQAGILQEQKDALRDDATLARIYKTKFNAVYRLGLVNLIHRPTRDITLLRKDEEQPGRRRIARVIKAEAPKVVCFIGKVAYEKYIGSKEFSFGWQDAIGKSRAFVMHFPLRGKALVRVHELRKIARAAYH
jgi:TDG/mug DNA glycosylase family protein